MGFRKDLTGKRYGRLTVLGFHSVAKSNRQSRWECLCDCGETKVILGPDFTTGKTTSCGCRRSEVTTSLNTTHGQTNTRAYSTWTNMLDRCTNPRNDHYRSYGERGITICARWMTFANFFDDMGAPADGMSIERIDNDEGYSADNCRWATPAEQSRNTRRNRFVLVCGIKTCVSDAEKIVGIGRHTLSKRSKEATGELYECMYRN